MTRAWNAIARWFLAPCPMAGMVAARVILGGGLFLAYLLRLRETDVLYGASSIAWYAPWRTFVADRGDFPFGGLFGALGELGDGPRSFVVWTMYAVLLLASLGFCVGLFTRLSGSLALLGHLFFVSLVPLSYWGWSQMIVPFLLYAILAPSGRWFSLDARRRPPDSAVPVGSAWPLRLMQLHVCTMYAEAGWSRIDDPDWLHGRALFGALSNTEYTRLALPWEHVLPLLTVLCFGVFLLEPLAPILLWPRWTRRWMALALLGMHVGLEVLTRVGFWNAVMVAGLCVFLPDRWLPRALTGRPRGPGSSQADRAPTASASPS